MNIAGLSGNLLPVHLKPLPDELLSSWLVRLAHGHGLKLQTFSSMIFGRDKSIWNRDIDKLSPEWLVERLSEATGTPLEQVRSTALKSYEGIIYEHHQTHGQTRWITPLGIFHRTRKDYGQQYCSMCLAGDADPYYRKRWRLAFYTECDVHQVLMRDRCPECASPVCFHRSEMGDRSMLHPLSLAQCYKCGFDLRKSQVLRTTCDDWRTFTAYRSSSLFHFLGWSFLGNEEFPYAHKLFDVLRHLCGLMISHRKSKSLLPYVAKLLGMDARGIDQSRAKCFEQRDVRERHILMCCAVWLLLEWPRRFVDVCKELELSSAYILVDFHDVPFWFSSVVDDELFHGQYSPAEEELRGAARWLSRQGLKPTIAAVSRLLGYATLKNRKGFGKEAGVA